MVYRVILDPTVGHDIAESIAWYNKAQPGLGVKFYKQVDIVVKSLRNNPLVYPIRYKSSRLAMVKKFPYMIHFFIDSEKETVVVTAILHIMSALIKIS